MNTINENIKKIREIANEEVATTFNHQENTTAQVNAHFRGLRRGKTIVAKEAISIIDELQVKIKEYEIGIKNASKNLCGLQGDGETEFNIISETTELLDNLCKN